MTPSPKVAVWTQIFYTMANCCKTNLVGHLISLRGSHFRFLLAKRKKREPSGIRARAWSDKE